jgi:hypothetical protein
VGAGLAEALVVVDTDLDHVVHRRRDVDGQERA